MEAEAQGLNNHVKQLQSNLAITAQEKNAVRNTVVTIAVYFGGAQFIIDVL